MGHQSRSHPVTLLCGLDLLTPLLESPWAPGPQELSHAFPCPADQIEEGRAGQQGWSGGVRCRSREPPLGSCCTLREQCAPRQARPRCNSQGWQRPCFPN